MTDQTKTKLDVHAMRQRLRDRLARIEAERNRGRVRLMIRHYAEIERYGLDAALYQEGSDNGHSDPARRGNTKIESHCTVQLMMRDLGLTWLREFLVATHAGSGWDHDRQLPLDMAAGLARWGRPGIGGAEDAEQHLRDMLLADLEAASTEACL